MSIFKVKQVFINIDMLNLSVIIGQSGVEDLFLEPRWWI